MAAGADGYVLGVSGGLDPALAAKLMADVEPFVETTTAAMPGELDRLRKLYVRVREW